MIKREKKSTSLFSYICQPLTCNSSQDCTIKVWDTEQGKLIRELKVFLTILDDHLL